MVGNNRQINLAKRHKYPIFNSLHAVSLSSFADFFFFFKMFLSVVSNVLDPYQDRQNVGPDLGPNCLQRLHVPVDDKSRR